MLSLNGAVLFAQLYPANGVEQKERFNAQTGHLTHVGSVLGGSVLVNAAKMIDFQNQICPYHGIGRARCLDFGFGRKPSCT
jgi:hypothetical protein